MNTTRTTTDINDRREQAVAKFRAAETATSELFDVAGALRSRLEAAALSSTGTDVVRAALDLIDAGHTIAVHLDELRRCALVAAEHTARKELAALLDTKPALLFPHPDGRTQPAPPSGVSYQIPPNLNGHEGSNWPAQEATE